MNDEETEDRAQVIAFVRQCESLPELLELSSTLANDGPNDVVFVINSCSDLGCDNWHAAFRGEEGEVYAIGTDPNPLHAIRQAVVRLLSDHIDDPPDGTTLH